MENWQYAYGQEDWRAYPGPKWTNDSEPGTYAQAEIALMRAIVQDDPTSDYSLHSPCILRRSDRHPEWQPVKDHAAELLAEMLGDLRLDFGVHGASVMQGSDLAKVFAKRAHLLNPNHSSEEFD